jgi:hypothetical protein
MDASSRGRESGGIRPSGCGGLIPLQEGSGVGVLGGDVEDPGDAEAVGQHW